MVTTPISQAGRELQHGDRTRRQVLPRPLTTLIGRDEEILLVRRLLADEAIRLVTLSGPSGVGKTRIAVRVAELMADAFPDGVWFVSLAPLNDPELVWPTVSKTIGLGDAGGRSHFEQIASFIDQKDSLLVLDNVEHLIQIASQIAGLLSHCRRLHVLATSQTLLRLTGEHDVPIDPLPLPGSRVQTMSELLSTEAGRLFVDRARAVRQDVGSTDDQAATIAAIVQRLEGLPLAIELAASRAKVMSPRALLARLENSLLFLSGGAVDQPERLRTMRSAIIWSYDLLSPEERLVFQRLAVFRGGFTLVAAEGVAAGAEHLPVFDIVVSLVEKSLIRYDEIPGDEQRYYMLRAIREFAFEQLSENDGERETRETHLRWYTELAEEGERELIGPEQDLWLRRLHAERDNFRFALTWAIERGDAASAQRLGSALWRFWAVHGDLQEGRQWLERALAISRDVDPRVLSKAEHHLGNLSFDLGDYHAARRHYEAGYALRQERNDPATIAESLNGLGLVALALGNYEEAERLHRQSLELRTNIGDEPGIGNSLSNLGDVALAVGDLSQARSLHERALASRREIGHLSGVGFSLYNLGVVSFHEGDFDDAEAKLQESFETFTSIGDKLGIGDAVFQLGRIARGRGRRGQAATFLGQAISVRNDIGDERGLIECLEEIAQLADDLGRHRESLRLHNAAAAHRLRIGAPLPPARAGGGADSDMGGPGSGAEDEGAQMPLAAMVDEAVQLVGQLATQPAPEDGSASTAQSEGAELLTRREREVLRLVIVGMTDQAIADTLFISRRTVTTHVQNIRGKLGVQNRAEAVARAIRDGLV
jgi:predicted ATPase/DNA-binding CsgD family transcriptional regulator